ncbi:MAG: S8 family serine peptidase [Blastococcus sp.]
MKSKRVQALVLATAVVAGYAGAAAFSAWAQPAVPIATDFGPDDGLTRYVLTATSGTASDDLLAELERTEGVVNAQRLRDGRALVATESLAPQHLEALPGVADAEFSTTVPVLGTVTDPFFPGYGYNLDNTGRNAGGQYAVADADVDAPEGWDGGTGAGAIVAVVDTGYDSDHPELAGALWTNPSCGSDTDGDGKVGDCHGWNFISDSPDVDNGSYGTHGASVSGVIGGRAGNGLGTAGVAPDVTIMPLVIGSGSSVDMMLGVEAIYYAVDHGADVINASWGGGATSGMLAGLRAAIAYAGSKGVLVVAAAGNDSANRDFSPMYPASLDEPALVTVGNSTPADRISGSSAYGAGTVDLFAPGELVFTTWNDGSYRLVSGTSIAAPQVAAAYALYRAAWPSATTAELRQALLDDVDPVPSFAGKSVTGGRLSIGSLADGALGAVRYTFASLSGPAGVLTPGITAAGEDAVGAYEVTIGLGMAHQGEIWAVADKAITLGSATGTTDDSGEVTFDLGSAGTLGELALSPSMTLGDGRYVLTVQLHRDGVPLGRTFAAPMLVGSAAVGGPDVVDGPEGSDGSGPVPDGSGGSGSGGSGGSGSDGSDGSGGSDDSGGSGSDGSGSDGSGADDSGDPSTGGGSGDGSGDGSGSDAGDGSGDTGDGSGGGGSTDPGAGSEDTGGGSGSGSSPDTGGGDPDGGSGSGSGSDSGDGSGDGSGSDSGNGSGGSGADDGGSPDDGAGDDGGMTTYPGVGPFLITSMSPTRVGVDGGTLVTITGNALPIDPTVRIGDAAAATVVRSSATELLFRIPARVEGDYDVHVFARDGREWTLVKALTYVPAATGGGDDGSDADSDAGSGGTGGGSSGSGDPDDGSDEGSDEGSGDSGGVAGPVTALGPHGERLVRTTKFAALGSIWSMDCRTSCTGVAI